MTSRRRFLLWSFASAVGMLHGSPFCYAKSQLAGTEYFLIGDGVRGSETLSGDKPYSAQAGRVKIWRYAQSGSREIALPFFPHSFAAHGDKPHRIVTFEKWGRHLAEIDLATQSVVRVTQAKPGRRFFGHGAHSGRYIYAVQMDDERGRGVVAVLDANDHRLLHEFETQGAYPHDCHLLGDSGTLVIVNSRSHAAHITSNENHSSVVWIDTQTGKCLAQRHIKTGEFGYAHLARSEDGYLVLSGSHDMENGRSSPLLAILRPDGSEQVIDMRGNTREHLRGEVLNSFIDNNAGELIITLPASNRVQVRNYRSGSLRLQTRMDEPRGLAYSDEMKSLLVSSAQTKGLHRLGIGAKGMSLMPLAMGNAGNGSHLCRFKL